MKDLINISKSGIPKIETVQKKIIKVHYSVGRNQHRKCGQLISPYAIHYSQLPCRGTDLGKFRYSYDMITIH